MNFQVTMSRRLIAACAIATMGALAIPSLAQDKKPFEPTVGQAGKDVVWVPTSQALVNRMLDIGRLKPGEIHYDLGSGDGRTVITAAKRGALAVGVEYNPKMVALSNFNAKQEGATNASFINGDIFKTDFSKANLITLFLLPELNVRLRPTILNMKPGTRVVSNSFDMGDWNPDMTIRVEEGCQTYCTGYMWIVPAQVNGNWKSEAGELVLQQKYQQVTGTLAKGDATMEITDGKVSADVLTFTAGGVRYSAK
ncbi:MAG: methyltransferase domain-containing protein, partial [Alphaproteobacteria bacterium]|nr:methyltransferase domain-containing protein [Alphaproteobacteria bacterium]